MALHDTQAIRPCVQVLRLRCAFPYHRCQQGFPFWQVLRLINALREEYPILEMPRVYFLLEAGLAKVIPVHPPRCIDRT